MTAAAAQQRVKRRRRATGMATRQEEERRKDERGERFIKQLADMFTASGQDIVGQIMPQIMPRPEIEAGMEHQDQIAEQAITGIRDLTAIVSNLQQTVPRIYADRAETKESMAELRTEIEKLKTARESDKERQYGMRYEDQGKRYEGDMLGERGWQTAQAKH